MKPGPRKRKARALEAKRAVRVNHTDGYWTTRSGLWAKDTRRRRRWLVWRRA